MNAVQAIRRIPLMNKENEARINTILDDTDYFMSDLCLFLNTTKDYRKLSNFVIIPKKFVNNDDGRTVTNSVTVCGFSANGYLQEVTLPLKEFEGLSWIPSKWEFNAVMEVAQNVTGHIRYITQKIGREFAENITVYTHTGWKEIEDKWVYLHGGGAVGADNVTVELEQSLSRYSLPPSYGDNFEAIAYSYFLKEAAPSEVTIPLLALVYLSPLNEFLRLAGHEPSFITMLVGKTGTMKSTLAALMLNHFGEDFTGKSLPGSFKDTANAMETKGFMLKDILSVIDDFHPATLRGEHDKMIVAMQSIIRSYGDRVGRGRLTSDAKLKGAFIPRGNLLVTGEDIPRVEESGLARLFILELEQGDVDVEKVSELQENSWLLCQSMRGYIEWLIPQADSLPDALSQKFLEYRKRASKDGLHQRIAETIAFLYLAYEMFLEYAIINSVIRENQRQSELEEVWYILVELGDRQNKMLISDNPVTLFLTALNEMLATGKCCCAKLRGDAPNPKSNENTYRGFIGYEDTKFLYLRPESALPAVFEHYRKQGIQFAVTKNSLFKHLRNENMIIHSGSDNRNTIVKTFSGKNERYLCLKKTAFEGLNDLE